MPPLPAFRHTLKIVPFKHEEKDVFRVQDQAEGLFEHQVLLPPVAFVVATYLDGRRGAEEVRQAIVGQFPEAELTAENVEEIARDLDEHLLLESDRAGERRREIRETWLQVPARAARFVPGTREEVQAEVDGYYAAEAGAGRAGGRKETPISGILAPHIDFHRGGTCYTHAYRELAERSDADVYVVLGVAHMSPPNPFVVTRKSYDTALGPVETDAEVVAALEKRVGRRIFDFEWLHGSEHSAEFQAVFLRHARPSAKFTVVPILASAFVQWCGDASPSTEPEIEEFLEALAESVRGRKVCFVAGVDFAHVGPVFGDDVKIDQKLVEWMMSGDTRSLQTILEGNPEAFWNSIMSDGDRRHVCGSSATYATLRLLGDVDGKVHKYGFAPDPAGGLVSFASMSFQSRSRIVLP
jgi:AmmeMemoRadiSam system protein B